MSTIERVRKFWMQTRGIGDEREIEERKSWIASVGLFVSLRNDD